MCVTSFDGKAVSDMMCYKEHRYYFYNSIVGEEKDLDDFVESLDSDVYDAHDWQDQTGEPKEDGDITLYPKNAIDNHYFMVTNLKGVYQIDNEVSNIQIFDRDIYERTLSSFVSNYYVTADYSENQRFRTFYIVDMITGKVEETKAPNYVSFDSYIQGIVDDKIYLYDRDNEKQYVINPKKKK